MQMPLPIKEKIRALRKAWGYFEVIPTYRPADGWKMYCAKNYAGSFVRKGNHVPGLPGNPLATRSIEVMGFTQDQAIHRAYSRFLCRHRKRHRSASGISQ